MWKTAIAIIITALVVGLTVALIVKPNPKSDDDRGWWCNDDFCSRTQEDCGGQCKPQRYAYCVGLDCLPTALKCVRRWHVMKEPNLDGCWGTE